MTLHICQRGILQIIHCQFLHSVSIKIVQRNKETTCIKHCPVLLSTSSRAHTLTTPYWWEPSESDSEVPMYQLPAVVSDDFKLSGNVANENIKEQLKKLA